MRLLFEATSEERERYKRDVNATFAQIDRLGLKALLDGRRSVDDLKNRLLVGLQDDPPLTILNFETQLTPALNKLLYDWAADLEYKHGGLFHSQALSLGTDVADHVLALVGATAPPRPKLRELQTDKGSIISGNTRSWIYKAVVNSMRDIKEEARQAILGGRDPDKALRSKELWDRVNRRAAQAIRTWQTEAVAKATDYRLVQLSSTIPNLKKQFLTGGKDPCPECRSFATRTFEVTGPNRGPRLPLHPNCECAYHPYVAGVTPSVTTTPRSGMVEFEQEPKAVIPSSEGGPRVEAPGNFPDSHAEQLADLAAQQKLRVAEDVTRSLPFPHQDLTSGELLSRVGGELSLMPQSLLSFWSENLDVHMELVASEPGSEFAAAYLPAKGRAYAEAITWLRSPGIILEEATHILDHGLGTKGKPFSAGGGINPAVSALGERFSKLYQENPGAIGEYASKNAREHLAWAVRLYHSVDRDKFRRENPELFEFIEQVWLNEGVWKEVLK